MIMQRALGLFALIPATVLLTISFFVLVTIQKIEKVGLKAFGYVVTSLLWVAALLVFSTGIYTLSTGRCIMQGRMHEMRQGKMGLMSGSMPMMMQGSMGQPATKK